MAAPNKKRQRRILRLPQEHQAIIHLRIRWESPREVVVRQKNVQNTSSSSSRGHKSRTRSRGGLSAKFGSWPQLKFWRRVVESPDCDGESNTDCAIVSFGGRGVLQALATNVKACLLDLQDAEDFEAKFPGLLKLICAVDRSYLGRAWRREQEAPGELSDIEIRTSNAYRHLSALKKPFNPAYRVVYRRNGCSSH